MFSTVTISCVITLLLRLWSIEVVRQKMFGWIGKLPRRVQWLAPLLLAVLASVGQGWLEGLRGDPLISYTFKESPELALVAIGIWHAAKRVTTRAELVAMVGSVAKLVSKGKLPPKIGSI